MRIFFVGDIVGKPGREALEHNLPQILQSRGIDLCIANAENAAAGNGITPRLGEELLRPGDRCSDFRQSCLGQEGSPALF